MESKSKFAFAAVVLGLLLIGAWFVRGGPGIWERDADPGDGASEEPANPADDAAPELLGRAEGDEEAADPAPTQLPAQPGSEAGIATGLVRDKVTKAPIVGARVCAQLKRGDQGRTLTETSTDAEGHFRLDLRALGEQAAIVMATTAIRLRVNASRYCSWSWPLQTAPDASSSLHWKFVEVELERGATVMGRVVDPLGKPVTYAQIGLRPVGGRHPTHYGWADTAGRFEVGVSTPGDYTGHVDVENVGTAAIDRFTVPQAGTVDLRDVRLLGPGTISGVLRYPDGTPAAYAKAAAWAVPASANPSGTPDAGAGLLTTRARADEKGRFVLRGLAPGRYYVADAAERPGGKARAQPGDWPIHDTGDEDVSVLVRGHRLVLVVRDEQGNAVPGAGYSIKWKRSEGGDPLNDDFSTGTLVGGSNIVTTRGRPGERLEVSVRAGKAALAEVVIEIREDVWEVLKYIVLRPPPREVGTLRITAVLDDHGQRIDGTYVTVKTPKTGAPVQYETPLPEGGLLPELTVGTYRLEATCGRTHRHRNDHMWLPVVRKFEIHPGKETKLELRPRPGARIRLTVFGEDLKRGSRGGLLHPLNCSTVRAGGSGWLNLGSFLTDHGPGHWSSGNAHPGKPALAWRLFETGTYTLRMVHEGHREIRREIQLVAGEILDVEVRLERE